MRKSYTTKLIKRPEMKFYLALDYTLPSTWPKSTQAEIQNDGGSLGSVISLKTRSRLSHLIKRESSTFSLRQYCLDFPIFTMIDSKFHFSTTFTSNLFFWTRDKNDTCLKHIVICQFTILLTEHFGFLFFSLHFFFFIVFVLLVFCC